jgi:hypothetical protein
VRGGQKEALGSIVGLILGLILIAAVLIIPTAVEHEEREDMFAGACIALEAKAEGDVCVKDDNVVLTREEFTALRIESEGK